MNKNHGLFWFTQAQSVVLFGSGLVFPFYILFLREVGASFMQFGFAYALFTLSSAVVHLIVGKYSDIFGRKYFLLASAWGVSLLFLLFPLVTELWQVYVLQILLGGFGAMQKTTEKALLGDITTKEIRGMQVGRYHSYIAIFSAFAIILAGFLIDLFSLDIIFYIGSMVLFLSGFIIMRI